MTFFKIRKNMATYLIGDVQGCFAELQNLLELIEFNPKQDRLGFAGDLVNRGPQSLEVLRFVKNLGNAYLVLGNHDFYLLAIGYEAVEYHGGHTLDAVLQAPDKFELLDWLRSQPLMIYWENVDSILVHAGIPPQWSLQQALAYSEEVSSELKGANFLKCLKELEFHRNAIEKWDEKLGKSERIRYVVNAFTHLRFCSEKGDLDLSNKSSHSQNPEYRPWYEWYQGKQKIFFGHWAALEGRLQHSHCHALDTGCVWGGSLTAVRIEDSCRFSTPALNTHRGDTV
jgi:bis(5'-nucleosyl)-tetraphosphatase (symmetrical)